MRLLETDVELVATAVAVASMLPLLFRRQRLQRLSYRGYRGALAPAVYASWGMLPLPMQDSLPAGWLAFAGRELNPLDRYERFPSCYISSPSPEFILTLRNRTSTPTSRLVQRNKLRSRITTTHRMRETDGSVSVIALD